MQYKKIAVNRWRQFENVEIELHPNLTILTGPNGSGKSTLLSLLELSMQSDYREPFLATPVSSNKSGGQKYSLGTLFRRLEFFKKNESSNHARHSIGSIVYASGKESEITAYDNDSLKYEVDIAGREHIIGFKISSHRALARYQEVQFLPVSGIKPKEAFDYFSSSQSHYQRGDRFYHQGKTVENPIAPMKETLIGFAAFGAENSHLKAVPELVGLYDKFQSLLSKLLPTEIGFQRLEVRSPEIIVVSKTGEFPIDSASGGLMALIQTAWQVFLYTEAYGDKAAVLIDEPENHLHPSLQRGFLGNLVKAFPSVQFVVATHSPFVITSVKDSKVYALRYVKIEENMNKSQSVVTAQEIDFVSKARTADKILDEVLGVSVTIPTWAEQELSRITEKFEKNELSEDSIKSLKEELKMAGLSEFIPEALGRIARD